MTNTGRRVRVAAVDWTDPDGAALRAKMDLEMKARYADRAATTPPPAEMAVDARDVVYTGVAWLDGRAVGHIALRRLADELEIKKLFVDGGLRGQGVGLALLTAAEDAARTLGADRVILQTGDRQPDAVALYVRAGYTPIPIFAPYLALPYSLCFDKRVSN
jgi:GNAT superfamily N-acetyltransferase